MLFLFPAAVLKRRNTDLRVACRNKKYQLGLCVQDHRAGLARLVALHMADTFVCDTMTC